MTDRPPNYRTTNRPSPAIFVPVDPEPRPLTPEELAEGARRVAELTPEELAGIQRMLAEPDDWDDEG